MTDRTSRLDTIVLHPLRRRWLLCASVLLAAAALLVAVPPARAQATATVQLPDFTELVEAVGPAVVNIRTLEKARSASSSGSGEIDPNIEEFFRRFGIPLPGRPDPRRGPPRRRRRRSSAGWARASSSAPTAS